MQAEWVDCRFDTAQVVGAVYPLSGCLKHPPCTTPCVGSVSRLVLVPPCSGTVLSGESSQTDFFCYSFKLDGDMTMNPLSPESLVFEQ